MTVRDPGSVPSVAGSLSPARVFEIRITNLSLSSRRAIYGPDDVAPSYSAQPVFVACPAEGPSMGRTTWHQATQHSPYLIVPINKAQLAETTFRRSPCNCQSIILEPKKKSDFNSNARVHQISSMGRTTWHQATQHCPQHLEPVGPDRD